MSKNFDSPIEIGFCGSMPEPKEAAPRTAEPLDEIGRECVVTRDTHRLLTETSEDFADRMRRTLIAERRQGVPKAATEGAPEATLFPPLGDTSLHFENADVLENVQDSEYAKQNIQRHLMFMTCNEKWSLYRAIVKMSREPKPKGAEKAVERPKRVWAQEAGGVKVYLAQVADAYMDALESRNAELQQQLDEALETRAIAIAGTVRDASQPCGWRNERAEKVEQELGAYKEQERILLERVELLTREANRACDFGLEGTTRLIAVESELATLKARESPESAWERGQIAMRSVLAEFIEIRYFKWKADQARAIGPFPFTAPTAEEDAK